MASRREAPSLREGEHPRILVVDVNGDVLERYLPAGAAKPTPFAPAICLRRQPTRTSRLTSPASSKRRVPVAKKPTEFAGNAVGGFGYPRPTYGIFVAITVMNCTLESRESVAMKTTARATSCTFMVGSIAVVPFA